MRFDTDLLTYDGGVEIERQVKLLEDISSINGDFSYSFSIPNTAKNRALLGIRSLNSTAFWNSKIETEILNNSGVPIYKGYLQIEGQDKNEHDETMAAAICLLGDDDMYNISRAFISFKFNEEDIKEIKALIEFPDDTKWSYYPNEIELYTDPHIASAKSFDFFLGWSTFLSETIFNSLISSRRRGILGIATLSS